MARSGEHNEPNFKSLKPTVASSADQSVKVMRTESNNCAREAARLELAAAKLHSLSLELDGRHSEVLKSRKDAAAKELKKRFVVSCVTLQLRVRVGSAPRANCYVFLFARPCLATIFLRGPLGN